MTNANMMLAVPGLERCFEPNPLLLSPRRGVIETQLEQLKDHLLEPILKSVESAALVQELRWVANGAAALAWFTVCPILVLPMLLEEKVRSALEWWERQENIRHRQAGEKPGQRTLSYEESARMDWRHRGQAA